MRFLVSKSEKFLGFLTVWNNGNENCFGGENLIRFRLPVWFKASAVCIFVLDS